MVKKVFRKCQFVRNQNGKLGQIKSIKRQKSFDFAKVHFTYTGRGKASGVTTDFLRKAKGTKKERAIIRENFRCRR